MKKTYSSFAKINFGLSVGKILENKKHELESIIFPIALKDKITLKKSDSFLVESNIDIANNVLHEVLKYFENNYDIPPTKVILDKKIPIAAGLGGGSSNCSTLINALDNFYGLKMTNEEKVNTAKLFGSDTVFSLFNKPSYVFNDGTSIKTFNFKINRKILLICSAERVLTKLAFSKISQDKEMKKIKYLDFINNYSDFISKAKNDFLPILLENKYFSNLFNDLLKINTNFKLSGTGPTFYLIGPTFGERKKIKKLLNKYSKSFSILSFV